MDGQMDRKIGEDRARLWTRTGEIMEEDRQLTESEMEIQPERLWWAQRTSRLGGRVRWAAIEGETEETEKKSNTEVWRKRQCD